MNADAVHVHLQHGPVNRGHRAVVHQLADPVGDGNGVRDHGALLSTGHKTAAGVVRTIGEELAHDRATGRAQAPHCHRSGQAHQRQSVAQANLHNACRLLGVPPDPVVQRAVRLEVADAHPGGARGFAQRLDLLGQVRHQRFVVHLEVSTAETLPVRVRHLGAHRHSPIGREPADPPHRGCVAGVEAASDVRLGDNLHQRCVVGKAFADVGVEVEPPSHHAIVIGVVSSRSR